MTPLLVPLEGAGIDAWLVGALCLVILAVLMFILLIFGKGREHS